MTHLPVSLEPNKVAAMQVWYAHHMVGANRETVKLASRQGGAVALTYCGPTQMAYGHYPGDGRSGWQEQVSDAKPPRLPAPVLRFGRPKGAREG
jgi:hypothetical protein